jgi:hypothetical protein
MSKKVEDGSNFFALLDYLNFMSLMYDFFQVTYEDQILKEDTETDGEVQRRSSATNAEPPSFMSQNSRRLFYISISNSISCSLNVINQF